MTPAARVQTAITILDEISAGAPVEKALTGWARRSRYAGSKDRAAVRDHVFDVIRQRRSLAALGGGDTGRHLMLGLCRKAELDPKTLFNGVNHAPAPLSNVEANGGRTPEPGAEAGDIPDWVWPKFKESLGDKAELAAKIMQTRAPVHLRVNTTRITRDDVIERLEVEGITSVPHPAASTALEVIEGARRINQSKAYSNGLVELQDAASQAVVETLPLAPGMRVLDFCAGGGGKSLALAAHPGVEVLAHDIAPKRMRDLPNRAGRAGAQIKLVTPSDLSSEGTFDLVLVDAPCSGSGSWRRAPAGKWTLTETGLKELLNIQLQVIENASFLVNASGVLAYATCSALACENDERVQAFVEKHNSWSPTTSQSWSVVDGTDGFFAAQLQRSF